MEKLQYLNHFTEEFLSKAKADTKPNLDRVLSDLCDPFNKDVFLKQRRYTRYLQRTERNILNFVNDYFKELGAKDVCFQTISDLCTILLGINYDCETTYGEPYFTITDLITKPALQPFLGSDLEKEMFTYIMKCQNNNLPFAVTNPNFIWEEFGTVMEHFLYEKIARIPDEIDEFNYLSHCLPEEPFEFAQILKELFSKVLSDFYIQFVYYKTTRENLQEEQMEQLKKEHEEALKTLEEKEKELDEMKETIHNLKDNLLELKHKNLEESQKNQKEFHKSAWELRNKYNKLVAKHNAQTEKYKNLLKRLDEEEPEEKEELEIEDIEIDMDGKYAFMIEPGHRCKTVLQNTFPNASFIDRGQKPGDVDCVIAMTSKMAHEGYKMMKEFCKNRGIPFRHCSNTNIDIVKEQIAKAMSTT